jgi:hypothetical protein
MAEGVQVHEDESLEHEADVMGARAIVSDPHPADAREEQKPAATSTPVTQTGSE